MEGKTYKDKLSERLSSMENPSEWQLKELQQVEEVMVAMRVIIDYGNVLGRPPEGLAEIMVDSIESSHRTLQQSVVTSLVQALIFYSNSRSDDRNAYSVSTCAKIKNFLEDSGLTSRGKYLAPYI